MVPLFQSEISPSAVLAHHTAIIGVDVLDVFEGLDAEREESNTWTAEGA